MHARTSLSRHESARSRRASERARVTTVDGYTYDFARLAVRSDSLIGTYVVVEEQVLGRDEIAYVDVERHTVLPLSQVAHVDVKRFDYGNTVLMGAGAVLFVIWAESVIGSDEPDDEGSGGNVKPPPRLD